MSQNPPLFLVAYDTSSQRRRTRLRTLLKQTAVGNQDSVYEHFLRGSIHWELLQELLAVVEPEDRLLVCAIDPRSTVHTWGLAQKPAKPQAVILS